MKSLILSLVLVLSSLFLNAQVQYKATLTELYVYNETTEDWDLYKKNPDVNIMIISEEEFITIQAKSPNMYKIYTDTKKPLTTKNFSGNSYVAKDLKNDSLVKIDILQHLTSEYIVISIFNKTEGLNLRYFLTKVK